MVKGTNKQIIEVQQTEHPYFERAILIVRADKAHIGAREKQFEARRFINRLTAQPTEAPKRRLWFGVFKLSGAAAVGAAATALLLRL